MQRVRVCRDHDTARQVEDAPSSFPSRLSHFSEGTARLVRAEARAVAPWSLIGSSSMFFNKIFLERLAHHLQIQSPSPRAAAAG